MDRPAPALSLIVEHARRVNFAMQQNGVPVVRRIAISNRSEHDAEEVVIRARLGGEFAEPWEGRIARIPPGTTYNLTEVRLRLSPAVLARQTEREATELTVEAVLGERVAASRIDPIDVLAANEWGGGAEFPEALAAFVTPNHPAIDGLLVEAGRLLSQWTGDGALSGYQSKSAARARAQVAAIYTAMAARGIGYINPPASFESSGQKVRLADQVLDGKLGTCLDLALVLAAAIEQAGLHPLIFVLRDHAFVGAWLVEETFADPIVDAPSRIANRVELDEMVIIEATGTTLSPTMDFDAAARRARGLLEDRERFAWALDVRAARRALVRPLPIRVGGVGGVVLVPAEGGAGDPVAPASVRAPEHGAMGAQAAAAGSESRTRLDRWKRKLLDLSLRNRLINYRPTAQSVELECPDIGALEDALSSGARFELLPRPEALVRGADPGGEGAVAAPAQLEARRAVLSEELANRRLRTALAPAELATRLTGIYRAARVSLDENGANTLFLALGSLVWYESAEATVPRTAPLLMLPLTMERRSVSEGFRVLLADEDPRINTTLVEKLSQEFGIDVRSLREPPEDDSGIDVAMVLRRFREAIKHIDRWEVRETAHVGLFTFSKFLMWLDLQERAEDLRRSRVVRYLVDRPDEAFDSEPFPDAAKLDEDARVAETLCPLDSDSSQLAAVRAACDGRTFVLEGPPGTGKSQTITNLIAQSLAAGKRVLFVAEKMAALSVVQRRLERVGLAPYCLEVHSNKASKKEVLEQIGRAFEAGKRGEPADFAALAAELETVRAALNDFVRVLHTPRASGESYYAVAARLIGLQKAPEIEMPLRDAAAVDGTTLSRLRSQIESLRVAAETVGDLPTHPLREFGRGAWTDALPEQVRAGIDATASAITRATNALQEVVRTIGGTGASANLEAMNGWSRADMTWLVGVARLLVDCPGVTGAILSEPGWSELRGQLAILIERGRKRNAMRAEVRANASEEIFELELDGLIAALKVGSARSWPLSWLSCRGARKSVRPVWLSTIPVNQLLIGVLERARMCRDETRWLQSDASEGARFFGRAYKEGEADWEAIQRMYTWTDGARQWLEQGPNDSLGAAIRAGAKRLSSDGIDELRGGALGDCLRLCIAACDDLEVSWRHLTGVVELMKDAMPSMNAPGHLSWMRGALARWRTGLSELNDWCYWRRARAGIDGEIEPLAVALESGACAAGVLSDAFERAFARQWLSAVGDAEPLLRDFNAGAHEGAIARFRELDRRYLELAAQVAAARVGQRVPSRMNVGNGGGGGGAPGSEMGVLSHQLALQRRHMPVRKLIGKLPNVLPRLKPCFLMSPLSVAQYLDPAYPPFDLVVFDEASQIPVWDAVGAIARGSSVVVVGDSKQLPPTNFFQKLDGEEGGPGDEEDFEELESVLDECTASGLPSLRLLWHYRSRHESLIAFSNYHYYDNRLLTFPGPEERSREMGVSLRLVEGGIYDRGGSRTNRAEAEAIVAEIVDRVRTRRETLGVVTFSQAQQTLIEDLLDGKRRESAELDAALSAGDEPVFVKNLENVQGDERDVILFSVCYAPDKTGRMAMSFGPLNRAGGERRLNVAVTRARRQVVVFSSIRADQIDLGRTRSVGAAHLKTFLDYAERGPASIGEAVAATAGAGAMTALERDVRSELEARGWQVDEQVGCSGYRIDLAVRDPARPGRYLLGIECDGRAYRSAQTARDRDRLRVSVLEGLGWRLHRVWSMQWRRNRARAIQGIEDALRAAQTAPAVESKVAAAAPAGATIAGAAAAKAGTSEVGVMTGLSAQPYIAFEARRPHGTPEEFHRAWRTSEVAATIREVVRHEGPIVPALLVRRVAAAWGVERVTARVEARVAEALAADGSRERPVLIGDAYWASDAAAREFAGFREPGDDPESRRDAEHIPTVEVTNAAAAVLGAHIALAENELVRQTAIALGFARPTERIAAEVRRGVVELVRRGGCEVVGGQARLPR